MSKTFLAVLCMALLATSVMAHGDHGDHSHDEEAASDVVILDSSNFDSELVNEPIALVEFFAPWCGHWSDDTHTRSARGRAAKGGESHRAGDTSKHSSTVGRASVSHCAVTRVWLLLSLPSANLLPPISLALLLLSREWPRYERENDAANTASADPPCLLSPSR